MDLKARARSPSDSRGDKGVDLSDGDRKWLAYSEDPGRVVEARNPPRLDDHLPVSTEGPRGPASAVDDLPEESPRGDRRDGFLRRPYRALHAALRSTSSMGRPAVSTDFLS